MQRLMRMRNKINPPIFGISTEISRISRKISGFQRRFPDFAKGTRFRGVGDPSSVALTKCRTSGQGYKPARMRSCRGGRGVKEEVVKVNL